MLLKSIHYFLFKKFIYKGIGLVLSVTAVIVGLWAQDGKLSPEHFQSRVHNAIVYGGTKEELFRTVITLFSYEGQWVIELLGTSGTVLKHQCLVHCLL